MDTLGVLSKRMAAALRDDRRADAVTSSRIEEREPSDEYNQPQVVLEVDTSLESREAFDMMERLNEAGRTIEDRLGLPAHTAVVVLHWRANADQE